MGPSQSGAGNSRTTWTILARGLEVVEGIADEYDDRLWQGNVVVLL